MNKKCGTPEGVQIRSILVIDDHPLYCDALASTLERLFDSRSVKKATSLQDGLRQMSSRVRLDLVMLDLKLPDATGISGFIKVKNRLPDVPVLVISAESSDDSVGALMSAGAAGFIPKDASVQVLQKALLEVREGRRFFPPGFTPSPKSRKSDLSTRQIASKIADLTPQQSRIMKLICAGKPNKQIAYELSLAEATVKAHITALLRRLGVSNRTQAAMMVNSISLGAEPQISDADARAMLS
ncbi:MULTISPECIES: response regulator transcription factor [unclassified Roseibium]|uniref:response regulator transcription factor n=1 Tax=unclassified Roseibium TaxID=2629323 RepID=UPI00317FCC6C